MIKIKLPLFIVFEGIDGSGKSTLCEMLFNFFLENGIEAVKDREPTDGYWGKQIRNLLQNGSANAEELFEFFLNDREDDVREHIVPSLENNKVIILDRYYFSNAAYQGAMGISPDLIINENRKRKFPEPDRVYLIDIDSETALKRISGRNSDSKADIFEKSGFLKRVRKNYKSISDNRFIIIDGGMDPENILKIIKKDIEDNFFII